MMMVVGSVLLAPAVGTGARSRLCTNTNENGFLELLLSFPLAS